MKALNTQNNILQFSWTCGVLICSIQYLDKMYFGGKMKSHILSS